MSYKSPIEIVMGQLESKIENEIYSAVQRVGVNVDKKELLRALNYDRNQYWNGYEDRDKKIVRCKECMHRYTQLCWCDHMARYDDDWFCGAGERKDIEEVTDDEEC